MTIPDVFDYHVNGIAIEIVDCLVVAIGKIIKWIMLFLIIPLIMAAILLILLSMVLFQLNSYTATTIFFMTIITFWMIIIINKVNEVYAKLKFVFYYRRMAFKVNEKNYPEIYKLIKLAGERLYLKNIPDIYIVQDPRLNALTVTTQRGYMLIFSSIIDQLDDNEMLFILGHELSHIKMMDKPDFSLIEALLELRHLKFNKLFEHFSVRVRNLKCFIYSITCRWYLEYLADLGGYEANQNLEASISALALLSAGKIVSKKMRNNNFIYTSYLDRKRPKRRQENRLI